jgi:hypothetical protein
LYFFQQSLTIAKQIGNLANQLITEESIADTYVKQSQNENASTYYKQALLVATGMMDQTSVDRIHAKEAAISGYLGH